MTDTDKERPRDVERPRDEQDRVTVEHDDMAPELRARLIVLYALNFKKQKEQN